MISFLNFIYKDLFTCIKYIILYEQLYSVSILNKMLPLIKLTVSRHRYILSFNVIYHIKMRHTLQSVEGHWGLVIMRMFL